MSIVKYPSPKEEQIRFTEYWEKYIDGICARDNFKVEYLDQLKILCDLFVEHDELVDDLKDEGRTFYSEGRNGNQIKMHPLVAQLNNVRAEVRAYTRCLGLVLNKDVGVNEDDKPKSKWK